MCCEQRGNFAHLGGTCALVRAHAPILPEIFFENAR